MTFPEEQGPSDHELLGAVRKAEYAKSSLDDAMFKKACEGVFEGLKAQRQRAPVADTTLHTKLILAEQVAEEVINYFRKVLQDGEAAAFELRRRRTVLEQMRALYHRDDPRGY